MWNWIYRSRRSIAYIGRACARGRSGALRFLSARSVFLKTYAFCLREVLNYCSRSRNGSFHRAHNAAASILRVHIIWIRPNRIPRDVLDNKVIELDNISGDNGNAPRGRQGNRGACLCLDAYYRRDNRQTD